MLKEKAHRKKERMKSDEKKYREYRERNRMKKKHGKM